MGKRGNKIYFILVSVCSEDGGRSNWSSWSSSDCSASCGQGYKKRVRKCDNPSPSFGASKCVQRNGKRGMEDSQYKRCNMGHCKNFFKIMFRIIKCITCF